MADTASGKLDGAKSLCYPPRVEPLIVYTHLPKSGGTSIRIYLQTVCANGCEVGGKISPAQAPFDSAVWIAGHFAVSNFMRLAHAHRRDTHYFASYRDPWDHFISYFNHRANEARGEIPISAQAASEHIGALRGADLSSPQDVLDIARRYCEPIFYQMAHQFLGTDWLTERPSDDFIDFGLSSYTAMAPHDRPDNLIRAFGFERSDTPADAMPAPWHNVRPYQFDPAVFQDPLVKDYLDERLDLARRIIARARLMFDAPREPLVDRTALRTDGK